MLILRPLTFHLLLAWAFRRASSCPDPRPSLLWAVLACDALTSLLTELPSLVGLLTGPSLASGGRPPPRLPGWPGSWTTALGGLLAVVGLTGPLALSDWPNEADVGTPDVLEQPTVRTVGLGVERVGPHRD